MEWKTREFWGDRGRVARIHAGPWAGRMLFAYPESVPGWWTIVVDPGPNPNAPGDLYIDDAEYLAALEEKGHFEWLALGDEEWQLEKDHFDWRKELSPDTRTLTTAQKLLAQIRTRFIKR